MQPIQGERRRRAGQKHRLCAAADTAGVRGGLSTEVSELHKGSEQPVIIQQVPQQTEPAAGEEQQNGQEEKEGVNNAS